MKFIEFVLIAVLINLSFAAVDELGLDFRLSNEVRTTTNFLGEYSDQQIRDGNLYCEQSASGKTFACRLEEYKDDRKLRGKSVTNNFQNEADNDFLSAIGMFRDIFTNGLFMPGKSYERFFDDKNSVLDDASQKDANEKLRSIVWIINTGVLFMYMLAIIQLLSGRNVETYK